MIRKWLKLVSKRNILERKEIRCFAKIAVDQAFHAERVMTMTFRHIAHQTLKTPRFESFELLLHRFHIRGERQLAAIIEDEMIRGVNALQIKHLAHGCSQSLKLCFI